MATYKHPGALYHIMDCHDLSGSIFMVVHLATYPSGDGIYRAPFYHFS
jgi:hypothetical protein